jgi:carbon monoxide dehydrogenase subunit G
MSGVHIEETFDVSASLADVWAALTTPEKIVVCIPGAALEVAEGERMYAGTVKVKVGAVAIQYRGTVEFVEVDSDRLYFKLVGKGSEKGGAGSARMTMETSLTASDAGGTTVSTTMDMQLAGKIVRFGRGMIQAVSKELFSQFTSCLSQTLLVETSFSPDVAPSEASEAVGGQRSTSKEEALSALPILFGSFVRWMRGLFS